MPIKEQESEMFGKSQNENTDNHRVSASAHKMPGRAVAGSAAPEASSISSGLSIIGKIIGHGVLTIFGQVEGELRASTVVIAEGAQMEGDVVAEELTIGGYVEGTSRRQENTTDTPSLVAHSQAVPIDVNRKGNGAPDGVNA